MTEPDPKFRAICVYCGSSDKVHPAYLSAAAEMGRALAEAGLRLVYGGGSTGLMGAVAGGALAAGGEVVGVAPRGLFAPSLLHAGLTRMELVETIHQRKARMSELADAFIALPGGYGTLEELFETLTWAQIGLHAKPVGLLNTRQYFDPLLELIRHAQKEGFIYDEQQALLLSGDDPRRLLEQMHRYQAPPNLARWMNR